MSEALPLPELPEPPKELIMKGTWGLAAAYAMTYARLAVEAERERCATLVTSGDYCRYVEHVQGCCDCAEMAASIRKGGQ